MISKKDISLSDSKELVLTGLPLKLFYYFDKVFLDSARELKAQEFYFPQYLPLEFLKKIDYLESFPQLAVFASTIRKEELSKVTSDEKISSKLIFTSNLLTSASCYHYFQFVEGKTLPGKVLATTINRCFRNEDSNSEERLSSFSMREVIFLGSEKFVEDTRMELLKKTESFAKKIGLKFKIEQAQDPFFLPLSKGKHVLQRLHPYKYELRLASREIDPLAISSFNNHSDFFIKKLNIKLKTKKGASGCAAFGIERWVWSFLATHGEKPSNWPKPIRINL